MSTDFNQHTSASENALSTAERRKRAREAERAEDVAYTINHAFACTATDFIDPYVGHLTQKFLGKEVSIGCHEHEGAHDHGPKRDGSKLSHWWIGEVVGDFGAVPITIGIQRTMPGLFDGIGRLMEPVLGPLFRKGAHRSAQKWAKQQGMDPASQECKNREEEIYRHEARHLPQALLWTVSSIALNLTTQRMIGNPAPFWHLAAGKAAGAGISAGLVVGGRAFAPETARKWDQLTSKHLFIPATKAVTGMLGIDDKVVDKIAAEQEADAQVQWADKITTNRDEHRNVASEGSTLF